MMGRYVFHWRVLGWPVYLYEGFFAWELQVGSWVLFWCHNTPPRWNHPDFIWRFGWMRDFRCRCGGGGFLGR